MIKIGSVGSKIAKKALILGSGELGKELAIELQRLGVEVMACDKYPNAPAMQIAQHSCVFNMLDGEKLKEVVKSYKPDHIIPEVEAIATSALIDLEKEGYHVTPTANAAWLTMNREGIRRLAAEKLGIRTSHYKFASTYDEFIQAVTEIGMPCVVKPIMSSSGHGQSVIKSEDDIKKAWKTSQEAGRAGAGKVIVEGFVNFDYEITLLTVRAVNGTLYCEPIGHVQKNGDYQYSWQPQVMPDETKQKAQEVAEKITTALGGYGIFGVELFVKDNDIIFSEVSPRPHDTGMVTMISQELSEFALHVRALLGIPIPEIKFFGPSASHAVVVEGDSNRVEFENIDGILSEPGVQMRIFGKPEVKGHRRMGVILANDSSVDKAKEKVFKAYNKLNVKVYHRE